MLRMNHEIKILRLIDKNLKKETKINKRMVLGRAWAEQDKFSIKIYNKVGKYNYNNILMHLKGYKGHEKIEPSYNGTFNFSRYVEKILIIDVAKLLKLKFAELSGYVTSGGTESNIYSMWVARNWAKDLLKSSEQISWIIPKSSHYSILKGINILGLNSSDNAIFYIDYDKNFVTDKNNIINILDEHAKKSKDMPLVIVLTAVTTEFGLIDPIEEVVQCIRKNNLNNVYLHIDACFSGMVLPFIKNFEKQFSYKEISSISVDFHKTLGGPIGSGLVLLNAGLHRFAQIDAAYLDGGADNTLIGSRNGISAIQVWALFQKYGFNNLKTKIDKSISLTNYFYEQLISIKELKILYKPFINYLIFECNLESKSKQDKLTVLLGRYSISSTTVEVKIGKPRNLYKMIMNHYISKKTLDLLIKELNIWSNYSN